MKRISYILVAIVCLACVVGKAKAQGIAIRTNLAYDALAIVNLGVDFTLNDKYTAGITIMGGDTYMKAPFDVELQGFQFEGRYWFSNQPYENFFLGIQFTPVHYKLKLKDHAPIDPNLVVGTPEYENQPIIKYGEVCRHYGIAAPLGFNFGYSWPINRRLNFEVCYGAGALFYVENRDKDEHLKGNLNVTDRDGSSKGYNIKFTPTNFGINMTYIFK